MTDEKCRKTPDLFTGETGNFPEWLRPTRTIITTSRDENGLKTARRITQKQVANGNWTPTKDTKK